MTSQAWVFTHDTYIDQNYPDTNYGSGTSIFVGAHYSKGITEMRGLERVDFSGVIPAGSTINIARFETYHVSDIGPWDDQTYEVDRYTDYTWDELDPTWNNKSAYDASHCDQGLWIAGGNLSIYLDVINIVNDAIASHSSIFNALIRMYSVAGEECWESWQSKEVGNAYKNQLYIEWTPPGAGHILKIAGVAWADVKSICGVPVVSVKKVAGEPTS